jgi:hypothetical protein
MVIFRDLLKPTEVAVGDAQLPIRRSFALGESAFVLQDEPYQERCPAIRHIDDIENRAKGSIEYRQKSDLVSQIPVNSFIDALIKIFGLCRSIEITVESSGVIMDDHPMFQVKVITKERQDRI